MIKCYQELNLNIFPFKQSVDFLLNDNWPENRMDKLHSIDQLNPELLDFFKLTGINIRETFLLINWRVHRPRPAHTDGNWFSGDKIVEKRQCGINWNFSPGTWVEFYSMENATPVYNPKGRIDDATIWPDVYKIIDRWDSAGPIIFNPQVPHRVNGLPDIKRRVSCTLRFVETFESLEKKLSEYIK